jgi:hypothetical protein
LFQELSAAFCAAPGTHPRAGLIRWFLSGLVWVRLGGRHFMPIGTLSSYLDECGAPYHFPLFTPFGPQSVPWAASSSRRDYYDPISYPEQLLWHALMLWLVNPALQALHLVDHGVAYLGLHRAGRVLPGQTHPLDVVELSCSAPSAGGRCESTP